MCWGGGGGGGHGSPGAYGLCTIWLPQTIKTIWPISLAAFTLPQKLVRLNRAGLGPDLAHFSGTVYIATKTSSVDPSPVRGARLYVLPFYSLFVE